MPYLDFSRALMSTKRAQKRPIYSPPRNIYETDADKAASVNMNRLEERYKVQNQEALQKQQQEVEAQQAYQRQIEEQNRQRIEYLNQQRIKNEQLSIQNQPPTQPTQPLAPPTPPPPPVTPLPTGVYIPSGPTTSPFAPTQIQRPQQPQQPTRTENVVPTGGTERLPQNFRMINNESPPGTGGLEPVPNNIEEIKRLSRLLAAIQGGYYGVS